MNKNFNDFYIQPLQENISVLVYDTILNKGIIKFQLDKGERFISFFLQEVLEVIGGSVDTNSKESNLKKGIQLVKSLYDDKYKEFGKSITKRRIKYLYKDVKFITGYKLCCPYEIYEILEILVDLTKKTVGDELLKYVLEKYFTDYDVRNCNSIYIPNHKMRLDLYCHNGFNNRLQYDKRIKLYNAILTNLESYDTQTCFQ